MPTIDEHDEAVQTRSLRSSADDTLGHTPLLSYISIAIVYKEQQSKRTQIAIRLEITSGATTRACHARRRSAWTRFPAPSLTTDEHLGLPSQLLQKITVAADYHSPLGRTAKRLCARLRRSFTSLNPSGAQYRHGRYALTNPPTRFSNSSYPDDCREA